LAKEPTLDPVIAHRSRRIASLLVGGEGHRHGLKSKGVWGREQKEIHVRGVDGRPSLSAFLLGAKVFTLAKRGRHCEGLAPIRGS